MKTYLFCGALVASFANCSYAVDIKAAVSPGYDSNPYRLADNLDHDEAWFVDSNFLVSQRLGQFKISGRIKNREYENSFNDADVLTGSLKGLYKNKNILLGQKINSRLSVETGFKDKTYVSRSTGSVGLSGAQEIGDRYDYDYWKLLGSSSIKLSQNVSTALTLKYNNRSYDDQNLAGLSTLDYEQVNLLNTWTYRNNQHNKFGLTLAVGERDYDDRRKKTKAGALVPDSDLKYFYHSIELSHLCRLTSKLTADVGIKYEERTDNGFGYYDTDKLLYTADLLYKLDTGVKLFLKTRYEDYEYNNSSITNENDEDLPGKQGYTLKLGAEKEFNATSNMPLTGFIGLRSDNYASNDPVYEYDRYQAFVGIRLNFKQ